MIEVRGLSKKYGSHFAVQNANFTIKAGEIVGFLGPNGAGKTTTMNIITGYLSPTVGTVTIDGYDILENPDEAKKRIGYLPEQPPLYLEMTVKEYLNFVYDLKKVKLPRGPHIMEICRLVKIDDVYDRIIKNLSKGYRQRVGIAQALLGNPDVLILDEPTVGLDPKQIIDIRNVIKHLGKTHTIILSSHILSEVQAICERIVIINRGRIVADDTPDKLSKNLSQEHSLVARIIGPENEITKTISSIRGVKAVTCLGVREKGAHEYLIEPEGTAEIRTDLFARLSDRKWPLILLRTNQMTLEEIFLELTERNVPLDEDEEAAPAPKEKKKRRKDILEEILVDDGHEDIIMYDDPGETGSDGDREAAPDEIAEAPEGDEPEAAEAPEGDEPEAAEAPEGDEPEAAEAAEADPDEINNSKEGDE